MNKPSTRTLITGSEEFLTMSEEDLKGMWNAYYPNKLGPMYATCALIQAVATLRGFDVTAWVD